MRSKSKEYFIKLPNNEEIPVGKQKSEDKFLELIKAEYGLSENDLKYFHFTKANNYYSLKLLFIPKIYENIESINAKKFIIFELIKNGFQCIVKLDDDLNKRAKFILDMINNDDPNVRETVQSRLSTVLDAPGELDRLLNKLLEDAQFNSFKYTVLNTNKTSCLLCVNLTAIVVRSLDSPYDVENCLCWSDIESIQKKRRKLQFHQGNTNFIEIPCISKKSVDSAHEYLTKCLHFINNGNLNTIKIASTGKNPFSRLASRIRQSFSRRDRRTRTLPQTSESLTKPPQHPVSSTQLDSPPPSSTKAVVSCTNSKHAPESLVSSEEVQEQPLSLFEPSLKTNSTYDVSLGSQSSLKPSNVFIEQAPETGKLLHRSIMTKEEGVTSSTAASVNYVANITGPGGASALADDHFSVKTTSTYEVPLDGLQSGYHKSGAVDFDPNNGDTSSCGGSLHLDKTVIQSMNNEQRSLDSFTQVTKEINYPATVTSFGTPHALNSGLANSSSFSSSFKPINEMVIGDNVSPKVYVEPSPNMTSRPAVGGHVPPPPPVRTTESASSSPKLDPIDVEVNKGVSPNKVVLFEDIQSKNDTESVSVNEPKTILADCQLASEIVEEVKEIPNIEDSTTISTNQTAEIDPTSYNLKTNDVTYKEDISLPNNLAEIEAKPEVTNTNNETSVDISITPKLESKLPRRTSIPSPKLQQRPSRIPAISPPVPDAINNTDAINTGNRSPSDKENYNESVIISSSSQEQAQGSNSNNNFVLLQQQEQQQKLQSKTTITSIATVGDNIVKKSTTKTETIIANSKIPGLENPPLASSPTNTNNNALSFSSGIPAPKSYKTTTSTTTITSTAKKPTMDSPSPKLSKMSANINNNNNNTNNNANNNNNAYSPIQSRIPTSGIPRRKSSATGQ